MRITRISVERFGPLRDLDIALRPPPQGGLVVVLGANEAGKSTLLRFLRTLLYGDGRERAEGALVVEHHGTPYRIAQRGGRNTLSLTDLDTGRTLEPGALRQLVGHLDAAVYRQVFAFDLSTLQQFETLTEQGVQEHIFSAAVQGAGRSVREAQRALNGELDRLWRPRSTSLLRDGARELRRAVNEVRAAEGAQATYQQVRDEEDAVAARIREHLEEGKRLQGASRRVEVLLELNAPWRERAKAQADLAAAPPAAEVPAATLERLRGLQTRREVARQGAKALEEEIGEWEQRIAAAAPDARVLSLGPRLATLASVLAIQRQRIAEDLPRCGQAVASAEILLASSLEALGPDWSEAQVASFPAAAFPTGEEDRFAGEQADLLARRDETANRRRAAADACVESDAHVAALRAEGADLRWLAARDGIEALAGERAGHRERAARLERVEAEERRSREDIAAACARLGPGWDAERIMAFSAHDAWRTEAEVARAAADGAAEPRARHQAAVDDAARQLAARRGERDGQTPPPGEAAAVEREQQEAQVRIAGLEGLAGTLQEWAQSRQEEQTYLLALHGLPPPAPRRARLATLVSLAVPLILAVWLFLARSPGPAVAVLAAGGVLAALNWPRVPGRAATVPSPDTERAKAAYREAVRRAEALDERRQAQARAAGLAADAGLGSVHAALTQARERAAALARAWDAHRRWAQASVAVERDEEHLAACRAALESAVAAEERQRASWRAWCDANGVPAHVRPADIPAFLTGVERAAELLRGDGQRRRERAELADAVAAWRGEVGRIAAELLPGPPLPPEEAVSRLRSEADRALGLHAASQAQARARQALAEAEAGAAAVAQALPEWQQRWAAWCTDHGLPPLEGPEDARTWRSQMRRAQERVAEARARRVELQQVRARTADWEGQAAGLLGEAGRSVPAAGPDLLRAVEQLAAEHGQAQRLAETRASAGAQRDERQRRLATQSRALVETEEAIAATLAECGAASEEELRGRLAWSERRREWARIVAAGEEQLRRRTGRDAEAFAALLDQDDPLGWEAERTQVQARLAALDEELNASGSGLRARLAAAQARRGALEASADAATLGLQREQLKTVLEQDLRRWVVSRLAQSLIAETLREYERRHVPEVLRSASRRFAAVTGGRYKEVRALDAGRMCVYSDGDAVLDAGVLSRGTQEQLYLVVRLGLVDVFARQRESLPIVLDDVLVNADPERRAALLRVLVDAAGDHQTFLLTCHPEVCAAILEEVPGAESVRLNRIASVVPPLVAARGEEEPASAFAAGAREAAAATAPGEPAAGDNGGGTAPASRAEAMRLVAACLQAAGRPLGRSDILQATGVAGAEWTPVIRALLEAGTVRQEGAGRGSVYALTAADG